MSFVDLIRRVNKGRVGELTLPPRHTRPSPSRQNRLTGGIRTMTGATRCAKDLLNRSTEQSNNPNVDMCVPNRPDLRNTRSQYRT